VLDGGLLGTVASRAPAAAIAEWIDGELLEGGLLVRSLHRYGPKAVTGLLLRPGRGRPTNPWLVGPRRTVL
jgi:hypothetical protein